MKITFTSNEVKAFNSYVNAVQASMKKVMNLLSIAKGSEPSTAKVEELTADEWRKAMSEARASGAVNEAVYTTDGSVVIDIKEEWVIGGLNATRRIFDKYVDLGVTLAIMAKQLFGGFDAEVKNIVNDELGALMQKQKVDVPALRAIEVESDVVKIEVAAENGVDAVEVGKLIAGFKRQHWVNQTQAQRIMAALNTYIVIPGNSFTTDDDSGFNVAYAIRAWTNVAAGTKV